MMKWHADAALDVRAARWKHETMPGKNNTHATRQPVASLCQGREWPALESLGVTCCWLWPSHQGGMLRGVSVWSSRRRC
eukprot:COSAG04_NODE_1047_length_8562_cov_9.403167_11_plen_79_part_00